MPGYIERDVVIDDIGDLFTICYETLPNEYGHHFIVEKELQTHLDFVRNLPAADVVEVVRCKDCKLWSSCLSKQEKQVLIDTNTDGVCEYWMSDGLMPNDFCSYGKRKEDEA